MSQIKLLKIIIFILLLVFLVSFLVHKINLPTDDLGRHIKAGEIILDKGSVPDVNLFSYAQADHPFINHHWLSEVIFYILFQMGGYVGLILFKVLVLLLAFSLVFFVALKRSNFFWATVFGFLCILVFVERTDVRPEMFSYLFVALYLYIFYLFDKGNKKAFWYLVPLQLLWVNLHIYFFVGVFLVLVFVLQYILPLLKSWVNHKGISADGRQLLMIMVLFVLVIFINPNFISGALYPLNVLNNYGYDIVENKSPFYLEDLMLNPHIDYFKILLVLIVLGFIFNHKRARLFDFLSGSFAVFLGWFALRNLPVMALLALPMLSVSFHQSVEASLREWIRESARMRVFFNNLKVVIFVLIFILLLFQVYANFVGKQGLLPVKIKEQGIGVTRDSEDAVKFFLENKIEGPVFNNFDIGSHLDFYFYPEPKTFVDNRPEAFDVEFWQYVYIPAQSDSEWWQVFSEHYGFNSIFFGHTDGTGWGRSFVERILGDEEWVPIYLDKHAVILVKAVGKNRSLIEKYALDREGVGVEINSLKPIKVDTGALEERKRGADYIQKNFKVLVK